MFCVECGREGELIGSVCHDCYSKKHVHATLPDHVDVTLCAHCSSALTSHGWEDVGSIREAAEIAIKESLVVPKGAKVVDMQVRLAEKDERNLDARVNILLGIDRHEFERELGTIVRLKRGSCTECSKQQGSYYEAIMQIRGQERVLSAQKEEEIERLVGSRVASMRKSSRDVFVSKVEHVKGGLDFYFSTISSARSIARELQESMCAEFKESSSLWGRRDGKDIYRMTFLVRLPGFARGDIVRCKDSVYLVRGLSKGTLRGIDLQTGEDRSLRTKVGAECTLEQPRARILNATVLVEKEDELQLLDPETNTAVEVRKPPGFSRTSDRVRLVKTKLGTFALSDSW